jgi:hypothetical protein
LLFIVYSIYLEIGKGRFCCVPYIKLFDKEIAEARSKSLQAQDEAKARYMSINWY